jgi:RNA polymerase sigma-70 factor (ECF subfamily)
LRAAAKRPAIFDCFFCEVQDRTKEHLEGVVSSWRSAMGEASDAQLLARWRDGDRSASETLTRRHYGSVLRYFELNASWAADDLAQRTFMAAVERADQVREGGAFKAYLMGIARRQLAMHLRELSRHATVDAYDACDEGPPRTKLSTIVARSHEQLLALRALASLPREPQLLLILHYWEGIRTPALAEHYGVPASTIRTRLARARDKLRARMAMMAGRSPQMPATDTDLEALFRALTVADVAAAVALQGQG